MMHCQRVMLHVEMEFGSTVTLVNTNNPEEGKKKSIEVEKENKKKKSFSLSSLRDFY